MFNMATLKQIEAKVDSILKRLNVLILEFGKMNDADTALQTADAAIVALLNTLVASVQSLTQTAITLVNQINSGAADPVIAQTTSDLQGAVTSAQQVLATLPSIPAVGSAAPTGTATASTASTEAAKSSP